MSCTHFEEILSSIHYTDEFPPALLDHFWEIRHLIVAWNRNTDENFIPSWINAIDKSTSKWLNEYTCPGFMFVPHKLWKFGNEYHDVGCGLSNIIWQVDLHEGKDWPSPSWEEGVRQPGIHHWDTSSFVKACSWNRKDTTHWPNHMFCFLLAVITGFYPSPKSF